LAPVAKREERQLEIVPVRRLCCRSLGVAVGPATVRLLKRAIGIAS
jgi:hypothetical protein